MARRKASGVGSAKAAGAVLIALALFGGISLVPQQTAHGPRVIAAHLGQAVGVGAVALLALCLLVGLVLFVRESFRLSARVWGMLLGYVVSLLVLHLRYPAGREILAAEGQRGGGYVGAALAVMLRRSVGEPGLWTVAVLGAGAALLLLSSVSLTSTLEALFQACQRVGATLAAAGDRVGQWAVSTAVALLRLGGGALAGGARALVWTGRVIRSCGARAATLGAWIALAPVRGAAAAAGGLRLLVLPRPRSMMESGRTEAGGYPGLDTRAGRAAEFPAGVSVHPAPLLSREDAFAAAVPATSPERPPAQRPVSAALESAGARSRRRTPLAAQETLVFPGRLERAYTLPDLSLFDAFPAGRARSGKVDPEEVARSLERTLASFGVDAKVVRWETGPVVTRYELQPAPGVKVQRITSLQNDIALALAASSVRLEAPIPGKSAIGVELPNERPGLVHLREILSSEEFQTSTSPLTVAIGKAIAGTPVVGDLLTMPHLLIAGATGAGKSVAINSMIASILFRATPEQVRLLMIDPKRVELTNYNGIPHLLSPVVTGPREAAAKLRWAIQEMESRYEMFAAAGVRNIQAFNAQHPDRPLAYILIIIDELADLMMVAPADFEEIICRLAQMTRAVGIHLLIATQRPSVDVITGLIKANIPSRISFSVTSQVDSRTILDHPGAEKLLGRGDMLFSPIGAVRPTRVQGAFISDAETERLVQFWRGQGEPAYAEDLVQARGDEADESAGDDVLLGDAARLIVRAGYASVSLLQRKMRIGYVRAARVVDQLEGKGIVGPAQGSSPREVLVGPDELERLLHKGSARGARGLDEAYDE
ncbi:MAG TPA: DNA translocase FtsK [bacterium]|nr:DNA translocase FtsK [bacterium]